MKVGEVVEVTTREAGKLNKRTLVLQDLGGSQYENEYVVVLLGNTASLEFYEQDVVIAKLAFQTHDYNNQTYQDITAKEIIRVKS
jgi:hypothetical protein